MSIEKTPVTIVTGFLGAGKTTLIRHLLQNPGGRRLAVLVNEFGDVGVDGDLIRACADASCPEANIVELTNGCICCTVADEFIPSIERLMALEPRPDHIVIETSGLALPKPLLKAFDWPELRSRITIDGVVAVADAEAVAKGLFAPDPGHPGDAADVDHETPLSEVFEDQIACADIVLLSKADLAGEAGLAEARRVIDAEAPRGLPVVSLTEGVIDPRIVLGLNAAAEDGLDARPSHHDGEAEHDHDDFDTMVVDMPEIADPQALADRVAALAGDHRILRVKGHVAVRDKPLRLLVQAVGPRVRHQFDRLWGQQPRQGRLVIIAEKGNLQPDVVRAALL
ncbi:cobalamin biosynthesis protein CobW [Haematobacter massiliensis]|uniref:Cobalamin biosynthesis protein CobW n=1 Tax=Haematobacter massiliensis TaxID=195105 RepID=A0A086Y5I7_9RHOB|nr:cobalamin biosynthesis protein CobW [Haematobacter massiliensis]KFI29537.1 cobalamin biosynthesis protein CobW [Haematobacter massiliensis]OWJ70148.1 cobalamin biosynthesis protein CobW [Haematobacter massiliensis]OWJ88249.1 cobalamin biosynthesis protein CobW [Haematobacter massiliensis]QBJ25602.1 cobalamin biosynthesis protein CobW [Haematobacter massiliensis]